MAIRLTKESMDLLESVQGKVNRDIRYKSDLQVFTVELRLANGT